MYVRRNVYHLKYNLLSRERNLRSLSYRVKERECVWALLYKSRSINNSAWEKIKPLQVYREMAERYHSACIIFVYRQSLARSKDVRHRRAGNPTSQCRLGFFVLAFPARVIYDRIFTRLDNLTGNVLTET